MSGSVNRVTLIGRAGKDPEQRMMAAMAAKARDILACNI